MLGKIAVAALVSVASVMILTGSAWAGPKEDKEPKKQKSEKEGRAKKQSKSKKGASDMPALSFTMKDIDGKEQDLRQYEGKVVLMVNVASKCGYTKQYTELQALYAKYKDKGLVVLGFPANEFGRQEPGTDQEIKSFCQSKFNVTFPMFSKVKVKGSGMCPLYKYLTDSHANHKHGGDVQWNFTKFLVNRKGQVVDRFDSRVKPDDEKLTSAVEKALEDAADAAKTTSKKGG